MNIRNKIQGLGFAGQFDWDFNIIKMSLSDIKQILYESNLNFDPNMPNEVCAFFQEYCIQPNKRQVCLLSKAAAAILSQIKHSQSQYQQANLSFGITIEAVMNQLRGESKEQFLNSVNSLIRRISLKKPKVLNGLSQKISNLQISYRLFKKYRKSFEYLWKATGIGSLVMKDLLSIFWVLYLLVKNKKQEIHEDTKRQLQSIVILIKSVFEHWIPVNNTEIVEIVINNNFGDSSSDISEENYISLHLEYSNLMQKIYQMNNKNVPISFNNFSRNPIQVAQFLSQISNSFYQERQNFQTHNYIDEISYLELRKMLTTKPIKIQADINTVQINEQLAFQKSKLPQDDLKQNKNNQNAPEVDSNNFMFGQNLTEMTPLRNKNFMALTPCANRIANLSWIRNCLDFMAKSEPYRIFKRVFEFVQGISEGEFQTEAKQRILYLVEEFIPKCLHKEKRVNEMFLFFKFLINKIYESHQQVENAQMFKQIKNINAILCLSCDIFNFAFSSRITSYRQYCQIFTVPLIEALKPINWIGKNIQKPVEIDNYLYSLEKRIVIKEIWEDETGYNLIRSQQNFKESKAIGYNDMIIWKRLAKHIFDRVEELSKEMKLQNKLNKMVKNLLESILKLKPFLLHKNKIDQIIICCMSSFLTINQIHQKETLEKVFKDYKRIDLSVNENREGMLGDGKEMSLTDFYNQIFLPEVQDIVENNIKDTDFLLTPIRRSFESMNTYQHQSIPFFQKQVQFVNPITFLGNSSSGMKIDQHFSLNMQKNKMAFSPKMSYRNKQILNDFRLVLMSHRMEQQNSEKSNLFRSSEGSNFSQLQKPSEMKEENLE